MWWSESDGCTEAMCNVRKLSLNKKKLLNILAARATLHGIFAASPVSLHSPYTCLAARPLVLYLGAGCPGSPVAGGVCRFAMA